MRQTTLAVKNGKAVLEPHSVCSVSTYCAVFLELFGPVR